MNRQLGWRERLFIAAFGSLLFGFILVTAWGMARGMP